ncbi:YggS family pyridoxal phosphate-dependent enzyme [bacterium]|nr:YggS family pyridoxal phosphate-dependent enzyme [bacterium]
MSNSIADNVGWVRENIARAARGRDVRLIGVTKTVSPDRIAEAYRAGVNIFGENRIQEAVPKITVLNSLAAEWHFIGHLQTNKARDAVRHFSWIQSIDSYKLLMQVEKEALKQQKHIDLLLELNLGGEETKHGLSEHELPGLLKAGTGLQWCKIHGLMVLPPFNEDSEKVRPYFRKVREIQERWQKDFSDLTELSMGMSHDYEVAIDEGATILRVGTAIFGSRD